MGHRISLSLMLVLAGVLLLASPLTAGRVTVPEPAKGKGDQCVADSMFMRKNHPSLLQHQRDDTLREGIRGNAYSLKDCISCHAVLDKNAQPVTYDDPKHFCRTCHTYVAVKLDCFDCHASTPDKKNSAELPEAHPPLNALSSWRRPDNLCQGG